MSEGSKRHIPLIAVLMMGMFLAILNQTLLNIAIPHLITEFHVSPTTAQWLLTGYMLINGVLIPLSAFLIDRFGMRNLFLIAMSFFTIGALICGAAPVFSVLLIGRLVQAVGAGIIMPLVMTMMLTLFPPEMRGKGMGIFGLGIMFAPAIGPTLSGWLLDHYSWRILFYGLVPFGIVVLLTASFLLRNSHQEKKIPFDLWGSVTSILGFGILLYGLSEAGRLGWDSTVVIGSLVIGAILILIFIFQQLRSQTPMLNFRIFRYDVFTLTNIIGMILTIGMFAGFFLLPIYLQNLRGFSAFESGLLMLPGAIVMGLMSPISGIIFDKVGPKPLGLIGTLITIVTTYEFAHLTLESSYTYIMILNLIRFFGISLLMMPITTAGLNQLPQHENKHGTALNNTLRQISGSIGISIITTIFSTRTSYHLGKLSEQMNLMDPNFSSAYQAQIQQYAQSTGLPIEQAQQALTTMLIGNAQQEAAMMGINDAYIIATALTVIAFVLSLFLRDVRKNKKNEPKQEQTEPVKEKGATEDPSKVKEMVTV